MPNQLKVTGSLVFQKGNVNVEIDNFASLDVTGTKYIKFIQEIGTSEEAIDLGDIGTPGYIVVINRDITNFIEIRAGSGLADLVKVGPKRMAMFELASATPYAIADTAVCDVEFLIIEA